MISFLYDSGSQYDSLHHMPSRTFSSFPGAFRRLHQRLLKGFSVFPSQPPFVSVSIFVSVSVASHSGSQILLTWTSRRVRLRLFLGLALWGPELPSRGPFAQVSGGHFGCLRGSVFETLSDSQSLLAVIEGLLQAPQPS